MDRHRSQSRLLAALAVLVLTATVLPLGILSGPKVQAVNPADKIEPELLNRLLNEGSSDWIVRFSEQADLSWAYRMSWHERGEYVVRVLREVADRSQRQAKAYLDSRGLRYQTLIAGNELYVWAGDLAALNAMTDLREVAYVRAARTYYLDPIVGDGPEQAPQALAWGISDTKANQFWTAFGVQGDGIIVANIDTGVQWNHPALDQAFKCGANPSDPACWADPSNICGGSACDNNGHGTHTMGTMVGDDDPGLAYQVGMAPNALWIACKGCESNSCSDYALNACADWILQPGGSAANRPHIVNNSWGGGGNNTWYLAKVNAWRAAGIFPAFSAGNSGSSCNTLGSPGDYQESFATAAHDSARNIASFSSRGPSAFGHNPYTKPNISAPGVNICSTVPGSGWDCTYDGTSMASPHTAGAVALLWSCNPGLIGNIDGTFQALQNTANAAPAGNCGAPPDGQGNYTYGYGYLDVLAAGQAYCTPPVTPTPTYTPSPTRTPPPPVTPNDWVNLPVLFKAKQLGPTPVPTLTPTPTQTPPSGWQTIIYEDFEGAFPGPWSVFDNYPGYGEYYWGKRDCRPYQGTFSGWGVGGGGSGSFLSCGSNYPDYAEGWMVYGPFSLADASAADMSFKLWLYTELNYDYVCRLYSTDGAYFDGTCTSGNSSGWIDRVLDLAPAVGQPNVWIALMFSSDLSINYAEGGYVDNILVRKCVGVCTLDARLSPAQGWVYEWPVHMVGPSVAP